MSGGAVSKYKLINVSINYLDFVEVMLPPPSNPLQPRSIIALHKVKYLKKKKKEYDSEKQTKNMLLWLSQNTALLLTSSSLFLLPVQTM